jgi:hypothetical protein
MVSTYGSLPGPDGISAYHWQIAVYLAWFANLTHLTALTFLRGHLYRHPIERNWRLFSMLLLFLLMVIAQGPIAYFNWNNSYVGIYPGTEPSAATPQSYARCFFDPRVAKIRFQTAVTDSDWDSSVDSADSVVNTSFSILLLCFSLLTRVIKLSRRFSGFTRHGIRRKLSRRLKNPILMHASNMTSQKPWKAALWFVLYVRPGVAFFLTGKLYFDIYSSMFFEVSHSFCFATRVILTGLISFFTYRLTWRSDLLALGFDDLGLHKSFLFARLCPCR